MTAWFRRLFARRNSDERVTIRPMKPDEIKAFDRAFAKMDEAFAKMDEAFAELDKAFKP